MSIEFEHVTKRFGSTTALDGISLTLEQGHIYGLLGNNGAGKSTLLSVLTDRQIADSGTILVGPPATTMLPCKSSSWWGNRTFSPQG